MTLLFETNLSIIVTSEQNENINNFSPYAA
jgi:hypothetical protein